jgi:putative membrane protein
VSASGGWHRLHPLSPAVRAGRGLLPLLLVLAPAWTLGGSGREGSASQLGVVGVLAALGFVSWLVTRWRIEGSDLRIETGLIRRSSRRFPLSQIQAIDTVRPGLARLFGLAELRLRMAGSTGTAGRLAYLRAEEADELRARLLALAHGGETAPPVTEHVLLRVPVSRLAASILISRSGLLVEAVAVAFAVALVLAPGQAVAVVGSSSFVLLGLVAGTWRRFNGEYGLTAAEADDGLRLRAGLLETTAETIRPGRVQAVRMVEPLLWRPLGWCRVQVDVAGRQRKRGENGAQGRQLRAVLPVGSREQARELIARLLPGAPTERLPPPRRARLKAPLRFRHLSWAVSPTCAVTTTGRVARTTDWVPLARVQSLRRDQGPLQRRLGLATLHLDTAGRNVHAAIRDRDAAEADRALADLVEACRAARRPLSP